MNSTASDAGRPPDSKAVLFCFDCGHESSIDGDWDLEQRDGCEAYQCPECGTTISVRPDQSVETDSRAVDANGGQQYCISD